MQNLFSSKAMVDLYISASFICQVSVLSNVTMIQSLDIFSEPHQRKKLQTMFLML